MAIDEAGAARAALAVNSAAPIQRLRPKPATPPLPIRHRDRFAAAAKPIMIDCREAGNRGPLGLCTGGFAVTLPPNLARMRATPSSARVDGPRAPEPPPDGTEPRCPC